VPPQPQLGLDPILQGDQPELGQAVALGRADVGVQELLEGPTPPQPSASRSSEAAASACPADSARRAWAVSSSNRTASSAPGTTRSR
jgi:hypothetical protein